jgi:hypothetical protein
MVSGEMETGAVPSGILRGVYFCCFAVKMPLGIAGDVPGVCAGTDSKLHHEISSGRFRELWKVSTHPVSPSIVAISIVLGEISSTSRGCPAGLVAGSLVEDGPNTDMRISRGDRSFIARTGKKSL